MRVLLIHHQMGHYGGAETVVAKLSSYLSKKGIDNTLLTLSRPPDNVIECKEIEIITPKKEFKYKNWNLSFSDCIRLMDEVIALNKLYRQHVNDFDIVNVHNFPATLSIFPKIKPCVWMCNEPPDLWYDSDDNHPAHLKMVRNAFLSVNKYAINRYIDTICVSDEFNSRRAFTRYNIQPEIIPYGIEHEFFLKGDGNKAVDRFSLDNSFILLQVGIISKSKNQIASIKAVEKLKDYIPNIKLVLAGLSDNGPYDKMIREYVHTKCLNKHVVFTGHLQKEDIRDLYHACDVALFPIKTQGGWLSPFEALSASKPIIVSSEMTASEIISRAEIGIVNDDIINAVLEVYNNQKYFQNLGKKGKLFVSKNFSWENYCQKMLILFEKMNAE